MQAFKDSYSRLIIWHSDCRCRLQFIELPFSPIFLIFDLTLSRLSHYWLNLQRCVAYYYVRILICMLLQHCTAVLLHLIVVHYITSPPDRCAYHHTGNFAIENLIFRLFFYTCIAAATLSADYYIASLTRTRHHGCCEEPVGLCLCSGILVA